jgi:hypothetical protein
MDRNYIQTGLKLGQHEEFRTYWGWSILAPACPGWGKKVGNEGEPIPDAFIVA